MLSTKNIAYETTDTVIQDTPVSELPKEILNYYMDNDYANKGIPLSVNTIKEIAKILERRMNMVKTRIIETTEKCDKDGKLVEKVTREEISKDDTVYESGEIYYPQEPKNSCCERKCGLKAEDVIKAVNDCAKRMGKSPFCF